MSSQRHQSIKDDFLWTVFSGQNREMRAKYDIYKHGYIRMQTNV